MLTLSITLGNLLLVGYNDCNREIIAGEVVTSDKCVIDCILFKKKSSNNPEISNNILDELHLRIHFPSINITTRTLNFKPSFSLNQDFSLGMNLLSLVEPSLSGKTKLLQIFAATINRQKWIQIGLRSGEQSILSS